MNQRLVNSAIIFLNSLCCSGVRGTLPFLVAYSLTFATLENLLADIVGFVVVIIFM